MKSSKFFKYLFVLAFLSVMYSCEKQTEGLSRVTNYVKLELKGEPCIFFEKGKPFDDPGVVALKNGVDVSSSVVVNPKVDGTVTGVFQVTYTAVNEDGFPSSVTRQVICYDPACPIATGKYDVSGVRTSKGTPSSFGGYQLIVAGLSPDKIWVEDLLGGFYCYGRGIGALYSCRDELNIVGNTLTHTGAGAVPAWGDAITSCTGSFDADAKIINFTTIYAEMVFDVQLTQ